MGQQKWDKLFGIDRIFFLGIDTLDQKSSFVNETKVWVCSVLVRQK